MQFSYDGAPKAPEYVPAGHPAHSALDVALLINPYVPRGHAVQAVCAVAFEYVPAGHIVHRDAAAPLNDPTGHAEHARAGPPGLK